MNDKTQEEIMEEIKNDPTKELVKPVETTKEQYEEQLKYAQKLLQILQGKLNEANGVNIQLEAKLEIATEATKEGI
jgi:hypothetical protein